MTMSMPIASWRPLGAARWCACRSATAARAGTLCLLLQTLLLAGCAVVGSPVDVAVAPNCRTVGYVWEDSLNGMAVSANILRRDLSLDLIDADTREHRRSVRLGPPGTLPRRLGSLSTWLAFSPDSQHVAVMAGGRLWVVGTGSGAPRRMTPEGERATSCIWTDEGELAYATVSETARSPGKRSRKRFWLVGSEQTYEARRLVYEGTGEESDWDMAAIWGYWPLDHWAPGGGYVVFVDHDRDRRLGMLNVPARQVHNFGRPHVSGVRVAWKPDGSAAFCASVASEGAPQAVLISPKTMEVTDLSDRAGGVCERWTSLAPAWTADSRYVLDRQSARLIRPVPWHVVEAGDVLEGSLGVRQGTRLELFLLPFPGYVGVWTWSGGRSPLRKVYAVTYDGKMCEELASLSPGLFAISPDGRFVVVVPPDEREVVWYPIGRTGSLSGRG